MKITIELSGGLELLFDKIKSREVDLPAAVVAMKDLIAWMRETLLRERTELFVAGETVRPGILVLINDVDWELEETLKYKLCDGDVIACISTLHGG